MSHSGNLEMSHIDDYVGLADGITDDERTRAWTAKDYRGYLRTSV